MPSARATLSVALGAALICWLGACGTRRQSPASRDHRLAIYAAAPLEGPTGARGRDLLDAERLALEAVGGRAGAFALRFVALDDTGPGQPGPDPGQMSQNARTAASDPAAVAYLGATDPGASAISIPITNRAGLLQVSPADTLPGLTVKSDAAPGEPDKYYPSAPRNFGRVIPADDREADVLTGYIVAQHVGQLALVDDQRPDDRAVTRGIAALAQARGLQIALRDTFDATPPDPRDLAATVGAAHADGIVLAVSDQTVALGLVRALHASDPALKLFLVGDLAGPAFARRMGAAQAIAYAITPAFLPGSAGERRQARMRALFKRRYGRAPGSWAAYGYEAMAVTLRAIATAGRRGADRRAVLDGFFATRDRRSVLGSYSVGADGDTTLASYGAYRLRGGALVFEAPLRTSGQ